MPLKPSHIFEPLNTSFILDSNTTFLPFDLHRSILGTFGKALMLIILYNYTSIKFYINSFFFLKSVRNTPKPTQADVGQNFRGREFSHVQPPMWRWFCLCNIIKQLYRSTPTEENGGHGKTSSSVSRWYFAGADPKVIVSHIFSVIFLRSDQILAFLGLLIDLLASWMPI